MLQFEQTNIVAAALDATSQVPHTFMKSYRILTNDEQEASDEDEVISSVLNASVNEVENEKEATKVKPYEEIETLFIGAYDVDIRDIVEPNQKYSEYRLRSVNQERVEQMVDTLGLRSAKTLNSQLTVMMFVCWSLTSLCHSNGHIETMSAREINPFTALTRIRS